MKYNDFLHFHFYNIFAINQMFIIRSSPSEVFLGKGVLKIRSKVTGQHTCRIAILIKLLGFSEHLFLRTPLEGCFYMMVLQDYFISCWLGKMFWSSISRPIKSVLLPSSWSSSSKVTCLQFQYECKSGNFIEVTLRHGCFPVNLLHVFRTTFYKNTSRELPLRMLQD